MAEHKLGTREEWQPPRRALLERENELAGLSREIAAQRRQLPWVPVEKQYTFQTDDGPRTLAELFDGRSQLLIYHIMFGATYSGACPGCSGLADHFDGGVIHLNHRDVTFVAVSRAPLVYHTYSRHAPDGDLLAPYYYQLLDQTPKGRVDEMFARGTTSTKTLARTPEPR